MRSARILAAIGLTNLLLGGAAQAATTTITFNGLPGPNGAVFTGPYTEGGFSVSVTAGQVFEGTVFGDGNPAPSLVVGSVFGGGPNGTVSVTDGGSNFSLTAFDLAGNNGAADFTVTGFEGASQIFSFSGSVNAGFEVFQTVTGLSAKINDLTFALTSHGTSLNLDNIVLGTVIPEPSTWAMMLLGFAGLGFVGYRQTIRRAKPQAV
jgi:hypothetical protein